MLCNALLRHTASSLKSLCSPPDGHKPLCSGPLAVDGDHQGFLLDVERWDLLDLHTAFAIRWPRQGRGHAATFTGGVFSFNSSTCAMAGFHQGSKVLRENRHPRLLFFDVERLKISEDTQVF